ncbi:MAG TPA: xylose isomerase [Armatimonadetes bacterium]|nr:xylose isomerase [Armatimonadota bacterium]
MAHIRQAFTVWPLRGVPHDQLFPAMAEIGFEGLDLASEDMIPLAKSAGLAIATMGGHQSLTDGLNKPQNHDRIEAELSEKIRYAAEHEVATLIIFSGNRAGMDDLVGMRNCAAGIKRVIGLAEELGVNLAMELLNSKVDHKDYMCDRTIWGVTLADLVGSPRFGLLYDIYHMQIQEGDVIRNIRDYGKYFLHYHTAGNPGRNDLDDAQELQYKPIMAAIAETGYTGFVGHEFSPKGEDKVAALRAAFETCRLD